MATNAEIIGDLECRNTRRIRLFPDSAFQSKSGYFEWLVCSSKFGIGLALLPNNRLVSYQTSNIHALPKSAETENEITNFPIRTIDYFQQNVQITFTRLSCNERVLAIGIDSQDGPFVHIYDIFAFSSAVDIQPFPLVTIKVSSGPDKLTCLSWNPESEDIFTAGASDGTLVTIKYSLNSRASFSIVGQIKMQPYPTCLSWSPKGKQLTVGDASGRLHQLKPELTNVKVIEAPSIPNITSPIQCAGVCWIATTDWLIAYREASNPLRLTVAFLVVKKNQAPVWSYFGDLTFQRPNAPQSFDTSIHFVPLFHWNMVFLFAHRSPDFAVIGQRNGNWITFVMEKYNIIMPVDSKKLDTYPIGAAFDFSSTSNVVLDYKNTESPTLPPQPMLHVLSSGGLLLPYNICSLNPSRPSLSITSTPISAQNVINGQQPANFQARQLPPQQPNQPVETVKFGHPSLSRQITQVTEQKENMPEINAKFESTLVSYSNSKNQLIEQMKQLALMTDLLDEKSTNFDTECIDTLWELFEKVQYSLENGIQTVGETSRKYANLMSGLKQTQSIWHKYLATNEQKRRSIAPSSTLDDLVKVTKKLEGLDEQIEELKKNYQIYCQSLKNDLSADQQSRTKTPISEAEQTRINKVNDVIAKRVAQHVKHLNSLQQHLSLMKYSVTKNSKEITLNESSQIGEQQRTPDSLSGDIRRLLLIVDGKTEASPLSKKANACALMDEKRTNKLTERQLALKNFLNARPSSTIQLVCPRKLIVDDIPASNKTPLRNRSIELGDQRLQKEIQSTKQSIMASKGASPRAGLTSGHLSFGSNVDSAAILNAAKPPVISTPKVSEGLLLLKQPYTSSTLLVNSDQSAVIETKPEPSKLSVNTVQLIPSIITPPVTTSSQTTAPSFSFTPATSSSQTTAPSFSFTPVTTSSQTTAPSFSFTPVTTSSQVAASAPSFSFAPKKDANDLSSAFVNLNPLGQQSVAPKPDEKVSFSFSPTKSSIDQLASKPGTFSFTPKTEIVTPSFLSQHPSTAQTSTPVFFSFAPKTNTQTTGFFVNPKSSFSSFSQPTNQSSGGFGSKPSFGVKPAFGNASNTTGSGFGSNPLSTGGGGFSAFANKGSSFGQLAQQSSGFGPSQQQSPFGSGFSGNTTSPFGSGSAFGSGGVSSFGSASSFSTPQQNKSSAFTAFRK